MEERVTYGEKSSSTRLARRRNRANRDKSYKIFAFLLVKSYICTEEKLGLDEQLQEFK